MQLATLKKWSMKIARNPFFWAFLLGIGSLHVVREFAYLRRSAPPPLVYVGNWSLTDQSNRAFGSKELAGKVYIANFFFTRCPTICPKITKDMIEVRKRFTTLRDKVHFVSISVDPENDVPQVLSDYMKRYDIVDGDWTYLTGTKAQVYGVVVEQMKLHMGDRETQKDVDTGEILYNVSHVAELALFDQNGDLRGKFPTDMTSLAALERAAKFLVEKGPDA
jgi:protein SCO1/2